MGTTTSGRSSEGSAGASPPFDPSSEPTGDPPPEAEELLIKEARRRQRRRWVLSAVGLAAAAGLVSGLMTASSTPPPRGPSRQHAAPSPASHPDRVVATRSETGLISWHGPLHWPRVFDTPLGLYLGWSSGPLAGGPFAQGELARVDPKSGTFVVTRNVGVSDVTVADGALFAVITGPTTPNRHAASVVRMDPLTLSVTGRWTLPAGRGPAEVLAAGGAIWMGSGDLLERVTPVSGTVTTSLTMPGAQGVSFATNTTGAVLVAAANIWTTSESYLERIDAVSGQVELKAPLPGFSPNSVTGIVGTALWVTRGGGMMAGASLYNLATLQPVGPQCRTGATTATCLLGPNSISVEMKGGRLWVTTNAPIRNYCARPSGQEISKLGVQRGEQVLAVGQRLLFTVTDTTPKTPTVSEAQIPPACSSS